MKEVVTQYLAGKRGEKPRVVPFSQTFNHISPLDLEEIMEWLEDNKYLSDKGKMFRKDFWYLFIKKTQ